MRKKTTLLIVCLCSTLFVFAQRTTLALTDKEVTTTSYTDKEVIIAGPTNLHLTATTKTLNNSIVNLNSEDSWVFFDNIRPKVVIDSLLQYVYVNGQAAVLKTNVRVSIYKHGTVVIPQSSTYQPLKVFTGQNFTGDSATYSMFTYYNALGTLDNKVRSFKLKRGYMATLATLSDGTGYSRVFIADDKDLEIAVMPNLLDKAVSFIRVFDWEWVTKKGWCGTGTSALELTKSTWCYDWSAFAATTGSSEYVPMHAKLTWAPFSQINGLQYVSHSLGFNEPEHPEQHKDDNGGLALTVSQTLAQWPDMLKSGLRLGAPACTDFSWLYAFMDSCKAKNYRVDYVAVHAYWGNTSPASWYSNLKYIYQKTGRPIWITEWNNGANWTTETTWPTTDRSLSTANANKQLADLKAILNVLDTASFVERYSLYNWVQDCRAVILGDTLTPAGKYYAADKSVMAFNKKYEVVPTYTFGSPSLAIAFTTKKNSLTITDPNGDYFRGYTVEKKIDSGSFTEIYRNENATTKTYSDTLDFNLGSRVRYRIKSIYNDGSVSAYSNEVGYDVTNNSDIQTGTVSLSNIGWNAVLFRKAYTATPAIILGSPTNSNSTVYMSARPKLVSYASRFNIQLAPWNYLNVSSLAKEETLPYFVIPYGTYDFGGLTAVANKALVGPTWIPVTFSTPFTTVPVVFASQLSPANAFATCVRVRNVTTTGFEMKIMKETAVTTALSVESVSYFAITPGTGLIDGRKIIVGKTANNAVTSTTYSTINYGDSVANPIFLSQLQTCNDDTITATMRCLSVTSKFTNVMKQRERSTGLTTSLAESAGWMVIGPANVLNGMDSPVLPVLTYYPNPVKNEVFINQSIAGSLVEIYNMYGVLLKQVRLEDSRMDVSDLTPGCYLIKMKGYNAAKFIKL